MSSWKVILATLIIFGAGVLTGGLVVRHQMGVPAPKRAVHPPPPPRFFTQRFVNRMQSELALTTEQRDRIEKLVSESQERLVILWKLVGPEMDEETRQLAEDIRAQLRPDQLAKFEQLMKERGRRGPGWDGRGPRPGTNFMEPKPHPTDPGR